MERVAAGRLADAVVAVPVDAAADGQRAGGVAGERRGGRAGRQRRVGGVRAGRVVAAQRAVDVRRDLRALGHAAVRRAAAHEVAPVLADVIVRQIEPANSSSSSRRRRHVDHSSVALFAAHACTQKRTVASCAPRPYNAFFRRVKRLDFSVFARIASEVTTLWRYTSAFIIIF